MCGDYTYLCRTQRTLVFHAQHVPNQIFWPTAAAQLPNTLIHIISSTYDTPCIFSFWAGEPVRSLYSAQNEALNVLVKLSKSCIVSWDTIMCIMFINLPCIELCSLYKSWHGLQCAPCHCKTFLSLAQWVLSRIVLGGGCITPPLWNLLYLEAQLQIMFFGAGQSLVFRKYRCGGALGFVSS